MSINPIIEDINNFLDYNNKTHAEFHVAIRNIEIARDEAIKKGAFIEAFNLQKLKRKFEKLFSKKILHEEIEEIKSLKRKH